MSDIEIQNKAAMTVRMSEITAEFVHITPGTAKDWLTRSEVKNRDWRPSNKKSLIEAMQRGKFVLNGEAIIFDSRDNILDGHHRLQACVEADIPFDSLVVRGVDRSVMSTMDTGASRDIVDDLTIQSPAHKEINGIVGKVLPLILKYTTRHLAPYWRTVPGKREILERNPDITAAAAATLNQASKTVRESVIGALRYLGGMGHRDKTEVYLSQLCNGENIKNGDPGYAVREYLLSTTKRLSKNRASLNNWEVFRACCVGLDRFVKGEEMHVVRIPKITLIPGADPKNIAKQLGIED